MNRVHVRLGAQASRADIASARAHQPSAMADHPAEYLVLGAWFGLVTGLAEVCFLALKKVFLHRMLFLSPHVVWMAPLADVVFFSIAALFLLLVSWRRSRLVSLQMACFVFAFLGFVSLLLLMGSWLNRYASCLLAAGLAVQSARFISARACRFHLLVRRTTGYMAALVLVLAGAVHGWCQLAEHRVLASLPTASRNAPNVLLITLDTVRAESLSLYGCPRPTTPQLERLAKSGVSFEWALSTAPWTLPAHASMFTGRFVHELSTTDWMAPLDATYPTLAEVLSTRGYLSAGFVANPVYCTYETGLNRGFAHYEDYAVSPGEIILSSSLGRAITNSSSARSMMGYYDILGRKTAARLNGDFLRWLSHNNRRPFFVFLNYFDAHEPYLPPQPFDAKFSHHTPRNNFLIKPRTHEASRSRKENMSPAEVEAELAAYEGSIAYLDHQIGLLFDELDERGLLKNTLIIITSDHGELFGEHGLFTHGNNLYLPVLHVPLVVLFPSRAPIGRTISNAVTLRDIPATIMDLLGFEHGGGFPGSSLARYWDSKPGHADPTAEPVLSEFNGEDSSPEWSGLNRSLVADQMHYICRGDGSEELYHYIEDPLEQNNLACSPENRQTVERLRACLRAVETSQRSSKSQTKLGFQRTGSAEPNRELAMIHDTFLSVTVGMRRPIQP